MKLIMVLGYLGSGKTTFVTNVLESLKGKTQLIVNDFGAQDVDGAVLDHEHTIKKIYDGSIFCSCKSDKFVEAMLECISKKPDNIIVEASGLANPYTMLRELNLIEEKGGVKFDLNVFTIVDAFTFEKMVQMVHAVKIQVEECDVCVLNKIDLVDENTLNRVSQLLETLTHGLIIKTTGARLKKYTGYKVVEKVKSALIEDLTIQKALIKVGLCDLVTLNEVAKRLSTISHRVKGIVCLDNKNYSYEYINGDYKLKEVESDESGFLVVLGALKGSLKKAILNIISDYDFLELV